MKDKPTPEPTNQSKLPIEGIEKSLKDALWMAYCNGRAGNEYVPEEVLPGLKVKLTEYGAVLLDKDQTPPPARRAISGEFIGDATQSDMREAGFRKVVNLDGTPVKEG